jgi:hypothetical protein
VVPDVKPEHGPTRVLSFGIPSGRRDPRRRVEHDLTVQWQILEGPGALAGMHNQAVTFLAPDEPGLTRVKVTVRQRDVVCTGEGLITVTHELIGQLGTATVSSQGLPG